MRDHGAWLHDPVSHCQICYCDAFGSLGHGPSTQDLAQASDEDRHMRQFYGLCQTGRQDRRGLWCHSAGSLADTPVVARLNACDNEPQCRKDGRVDGEHQNGHRKPVTPGEEQTLLGSARIVVFRP